MRLQPEFYRGKRVFITGHTGFKGTWLSRILELFGAEVTGFSLSSPTEEGASIFETAVAAGMKSNIGDIRDFPALKKAFDEARPEIVLHLAAQPIVIESYRDPRGTYETNVMGTVNLLECVRSSDTVRSVLNVTTDKVYENKEWEWGYRECDPLDGYDPYSNSKSCSELVTHSYRKSFFHDGKIVVSTARAGNVIGGGDFAANRIVPDCVRAAIAGREIEVRNPNSTRPYQHVLEPLCAYLLIAQEQYKDAGCAGWYNVGPDDCDCVTTGELADMFCRLWGEGQGWRAIDVDGPHEANFLRLDCARIRAAFGWQPHWHIEDAIGRTVEWAKAWKEEEDITAVMDRQIQEFVGKDGGGKK